MSTTQVLLARQHAAPEGPVDLLNMYVMHHAFRRDLTAFGKAVAHAAIDDHRRWRALQRRWGIFASALHHHHAAEDDGLWPLMLERVTVADDAGAPDVLKAMQAEHARIDPLLTACEGAFAGMTVEGDETLRATLGRLLDEAWRLLDGHLGHEEADAMAVLQRHLTEADWERVERDHFRPAYSLREILTIVPWSQTGLPDDVRRRTLAAGGPAIKLIWLLSRGSFGRLDAAAFE